MSNRRMMCLFLLPALALSAWLVGDRVLGQVAVTDEVAPVGPADVSDSDPESASEYDVFDEPADTPGVPVPSVGRFPPPRVPSTSSARPVAPTERLIGIPTPPQDPLMSSPPVSRSRSIPYDTTPLPGSGSHYGYNSDAGVYGLTAAEAYSAVYASRGRPIDPEMAKLLQVDQQMEAAAQMLVKSYRNAQDEDSREIVRVEIRKLTEKHFLLRQNRREMEISKLADQLERVREAVQKRTDRKQMIIDRRVSQLLGEQDELAF